MSFLGYPRPDGNCGIRNYVLVIPGGIVAERICSLVRGTRTLATPVSGSVTQNETGRAWLECWWDWDEIPM